MKFLIGYFWAVNKYNSCGYGRTDCEATVLIDACLLIPFLTYDLSKIQFLITYSIQNYASHMKAFH